MWDLFRPGGLGNRVNAWGVGRDQQRPPPCRHQWPFFPSSVHSFSHQSIHSLITSSTNSFIHSFIPLFMSWFTHSCIPQFIRSIILSLAQSPMPAAIHTCIYSPPSTLSMISVISSLTTILCRNVHHLYIPSFPSTCLLSPLLPCSSFLHLVYFIFFTFILFSVCLFPLECHCHKARTLFYPLLYPQCLLIVGAH